MARFPVPPPIYGLNDDKPFSQQPVGTSQDLLNVRAQDPVEKRERISQRSGLRDITGPTQAQVNGGNKVQHLAKVTFANQTVDYAEIADATLHGTTEWTANFKGKSARNVKIDRQNNSYWIVGRDLLVKLNSQGTEVWRYTVPIKEATHTLRGLALDALSNIWVASGATQDYSDDSFAPIDFTDVQENLRIWRISARTNTDLEEEPELTGEFEPSGFVQDLTVANGFLYYVQNRPDAYEADLVILQGFGVNSLVTSTSPAAIAVRGVPYPVNSLGVNSSGEIIVSSEPFTDRTVNPKYPNLSKVSNLVNLPGLWTPHRNLPNTAALYSEYRPALETGYSNSDGIAVLTDLTGNGRDFSVQQAVATGHSLAGNFANPVYLERVIGDAAGIRFDGSTGAMATRTNLDSEYQSRSASQRTAWPSYGSSTGSPKVADDTCAQYVYFLLARLVREATKGAIIGQRSNVEFPSGGPHTELPYALVANRPQGTLVTQTASSGIVSLYDWVREAAGGDYESDYTPQGPATANVRFPREGDLNGTRSGEIDEEVPEDPPVALFTLMVDNAVDFAASDDAVMRSGWRMNGRPMDRWKGSIRISEERVTLGFSADNGGAGLGDDHGMFNGDIVYMACVARLDPTSTTEPKVMEHQFTSRRVQRQSIQVNATGGNLDLTVTYPDGTTETASTIAYNAAAASVESALEGLSGIGASDVTVTGTNLITGDLVVHWGYNDGATKPTGTTYPTGVYAGLQMPLIIADDTNLTGLGAPTGIVSVADVEDGSASTWNQHNASLETDLEKMEGWIMHEHGCQHLLPGPHNDPTVQFRHPYSINPPLDEDAVDPTDLLSTNAILAKYGTGDLSLKWLETDKGGIGYGMTVNKDDNLVTVGPQQSSPADAYEYRFIEDTGDSVVFTTEGLFAAPGFQDRHVRMDTDEDATVYIPRYPDAHTAVDDGGLGIATIAGGSDVFEFVRTTGSWITDGFTVGESVRATGFGSSTDADWVVENVTATNLRVTDVGDTNGDPPEAASAAQTVTRLDYVTAEVFASDGTAEAEYRSSTTADAVVGAYAAASPVDRPEYGATSTIDRDEFLFLGTNQTPPGGGTVDANTARKVRIVSATHNNSSPRDTKLYVVAGGGVRVWNGGSTYASLGTAATGDDVLSSSSTFFSSAELFGKLYLTDGVSPTRVIDPTLAPLATGQVSTLKADDGGEVPIARIIFAWRGRLGWAHSPDSPHFWKLAEIGKPANVNEFPPEPFVGQAISGLNSPETGEAPDIINTVVTGSEDYLLFGGDHSITALVGDPTSSGLIARGDLGQSIGQFQTVSDSTGMAFGKPWARDKMDTIFFYSSRGEAFALRPGSKPEPISDRAIEKRLQQIDFSTHYVDAQWNWEDNCVHFFVIPFGSATVEVHHIFDVQRGKLMQAEGGDAISVGWWRDKFGHADVQPTAVTVFDGDKATDRSLLIGCADGRVRKWDPSANNDGETGARAKVKIDAYCTYGPLMPQSAGGEYMFTDLEVDLDRNQSGALVEYLAADTGDFPNTPDPQGIVLTSGYNPPLHERVTGSYCGFRIRNSATDERFSVDRVMIDASKMGDRRART